MVELVYTYDSKSYAARLEGSTPSRGTNEYSELVFKVMKKPKIVAIVGPTASGKTSLSIEIAKHFDGEIISADSRQVYRGLDIGSGKVTAEEMSNIPHYLLDVADIHTVYTAADFAHDATTAIHGILDRQHLPIIAGGTFFYLDQLRGATLPQVSPNPILREKLEMFSTTELFQQLQEADSKRAETIDPHNRRRLVRALEIVETLGQVPKRTEIESSYDWLIIGIDIPTTKLHQNIHQRLLKRLESGMVKEVRDLLKQDVSHQRLNELGLEYRYISEYLQNKLAYEEMVTQLETKIKQFAKRQLTWLRRDEAIVWFAPENREAIFQLVEKFLSE